MFRPFVISILLCVAVCSTAALESFLYLDGIKGESVSSRHSGWIEIESVSMAAAKRTNTQAQLSTLDVRKRIDKATPALFLHTANGRIIPHGTIETIRLGERGPRLLQLRMTDVQVANMDQSGYSGESGHDQVSLRFKTIRWTYTEIRADGSALRDITATWNLATQSGSGGTIADDTDNDGMPDEFERTHGLKLDQPDAEEDPDGDGMTNLEEFRAGTLPNRAESIFRVTGVRSGSGGASLDWEPAAGKTYRLMGAASPEQPFQFIRFLSEAEAAAGRLDIPANSSFQFFTLQVD
jgi:type VI secretion system Hcp family effector